MLKRVTATSTFPTIAAERDAFLAAAGHADFRSLSRCASWTVHDLVAHVTAAAAETAGTVEVSRSGATAPPTQEFGVREAAYRELSAAELLEALNGELTRLSTVFDDALTADPNATADFAGVASPVAGLVRHKRSELAIHRWDITGDDDVSRAALSDPSLTQHAALLGHLLLTGGPALFGEMGTRFEAALRSPEELDIVVVVDAAGSRLEVRDADDSAPAVNAAPWARLLLLWGRVPTTPGAVVSEIPRVALRRLRAALTGF